jgi:flagellar biosynthesis/type III secretory pathway protein FliH
MLTGCSALDELIRVTDSNLSGQSGNYYQRSQPYNQSAYSDGYQQGYQTGYSDAQRRKGYRPQSNYGGSSYNSAFSDGYYKGYEVGYYDFKNRGTYNLR